MPRPSTKLAAIDRKDAIVAAAIPVFARLGRAGATTKIIAPGRRRVRSAAL